MRKPMNLPFWIARKYFYSRKIPNVIHVISRISQLGITIGTIALIVILSVFNGFEDVVISLYNSFDSDIRITSVNSKYFSIDSSKLNEIKRIPSVKFSTPVIEENALIKSRQNQTIALLKAVEPDYIGSTGLDSMMLFGEAVLRADNRNYALIGSGVAGKLGLNAFDNVSTIQVYFPRKGNPNRYLLNPEKAFVVESLLPGGIFSIQQDFDSRYILVPLEFMRNLVGESDKVTAWELNLTSRDGMKSTARQIRHILGKDFTVSDRYQQHTWLYKIMHSEKLMVFLILSFILIIAGFNLIGSLLMLSLEKKKDMMILKSVGAEEGLIRKIIFYEGMLLSLSGAVAGLLAGALICFLQLKFKLVPIHSSGTFVLDAFPVSLRLMDFVWVFAVVTLIGFISSYFPARAAYRELNLSDLHK